MSRPRSVSRDLCDERHKNIKDTLSRIEKKLDGVIGFKSSINWLTWGFRAIIISLIGLVFFIVQTSI